MSAPATLLAGAPAASSGFRLGDAALARLLLAIVVLFLLAALALPLATLLSEAFRNQVGGFVGLANFAEYVTTPSLVVSAWNSVWVAALTTVIVLPAAFVYAYALTRSAIPGKTLFRAIALVPLLGPSLLPSLALIYLFGNQGMLNGLLLGGTIYGPLGILISQVFYCFPAAVMILVVALTAADARLYEAAAALRATRVRTFLTVTLPGAKYGLMSAGFVVFTLVVTDFGIAKVIGGQFNVLATEVYKQVVGQQNFQMGAVVGIVLLLPALLAFGVERYARARQVALLSARAVPYTPKARAPRDLPLLVYCVVVSALLLGLVAVAAWGSLVTFWPYNLALTWANYDFARFDSAGWSSYWNSVQFAAWTAVIGTAFIFTAAYVLDRTKGDQGLRQIAQFLVMIPLAVPGLVLGIAYVFFFNAPWNPLGFLYGTLAILVLNTITHFYTVCHLTAGTALKSLDPEFENVSASLKVPVWRTFGKVIVPICLPAVLEIAVYLFVNAITTVSAVVFLYGPDTKLASIAVVQMDEAGQASAAAAMAMVIFGTSALVKLAQVGLAATLEKTQAWRRR